MSASDDPLLTSSQPSSFPQKKAEQLVYIFNMSEDVWPFISAISDQAKKEYEIKDNANLADRELFSLAREPGAIFVSPSEIDADFFSYFTQLMRSRDLTVLVPEKHTGEICRDCLVDHRLFNHLVTVGKRVTRLVLVPYSTSFQFLELVSALREAGIEVSTPESPQEEDAWTVNFFGSKSGIRQLAQKSVAVEPDLLMPDGLICVSRIDAARIAASKYLKEKGVVIKTNKGHSGAGVLIFREGELPTEYKACEQAILRKLKEDAYWEMFPVVVESLININSAVAGGFPNVEFKIRKSGEIEFLFFCGLRVTREGVFQGVEINEDVLHDRLEARLIDTGFYVGEQFAAAGYRGFFDVDFVASKNNRIYVTESNVRRTGGTFSYEATLALIGNNFLKESYTLTNTMYRLPGKQQPSFAQLRTLLEPILYQPRTKEGLVIASANTLKQGQLSYMIYGRNERTSLAIEARMTELLQQLS